MDTAQDLRAKTEERQETLKRIKSKYKHISKKHAKLKKKIEKKAEDEALIQAT